MNEKNVTHIGSYSRHEVMQRKEKQGAFENGKVAHARCKSRC